MFGVCVHAGECAGRWVCAHAAGAGSKQMMQRLFFFFVGVMETLPKIVLFPARKAFLAQVIIFPAYSSVSTFHLNSANYL